MDCESVLISYAHRFNVLFFVDPELAASQFLAHDEHLRIVQYHVVSTILCRRSLCCTVCLPCPSRLVRPVVRPVPNVFLSLHKNTERISMKFAGGSHYHHEQIK